MNGKAYIRLLPEVSQSAIEMVDATPDEEYPLRILRAYRENANVLWKREPPDVVFEMMNEDQRKRAAIRDRAITKLERS